MPQKEIKGRKEGRERKERKRKWWSWKEKLYKRGGGKKKGIVNVAVFVCAYRDEKFMNVDVTSWHQLWMNIV